MDINQFPQATRRNPRPHLKYLILDGPRAGWVMPGNMLRRADESPFGGTTLAEWVIPINPSVEVGDRVLPLRMRNSEMAEDTVSAVETKFIMTRERREAAQQWVVLPNTLSDIDKRVFMLQIREHLLLAGYEEESRRRGWNQFWRDVNESAGFTLRPVPTVMQVRAKWRIGRHEMNNFVVPDRMQEIVSASDEVVTTHVTTEHTVLLPNQAAECRCADHARIHRVGEEVTAGAGYREVSQLLTVGTKTRFELHSVTVRSIDCAFGLVSV